MAENKDAVARALYDTLTSQDVANASLEPANVVDVLSKIGDGLLSIGDGISALASAVREVALAIEHHLPEEQ